MTRLLTGPTWACGCPLDEPHDLTHPECERACREAVEAWMPDRQPVRAYEYDEDGLEALVRLEVDDE
jgi:hypothetical protein